MYYNNNKGPSLLMPLTRGQHFKDAADKNRAEINF